MRSASIWTAKIKQHFVDLTEPAPAHPKSGLQDYVPDAYTSCRECLHAASPSEKEVTCAACQAIWHEECVKHLLPVDYMEGVEGCIWWCPDCVNPIGGRWDSEMCVI